MGYVYSKAFLRSAANSARLDKLLNECFEEVDRLEPGLTQRKRWEKAYILLVMRAPDRGVKI